MVTQDIVTKDAYCCTGFCRKEHHLCEEPECEYCFVAYNTAAELRQHRMQVRCLAVHFMKHSTSSCCWREHACRVRENPPMSILPLPGLGGPHLACMRVCASYKEIGSPSTAFAVCLAMQVHSRSMPRFDRSRARLLDISDAFPSHSGLPSHPRSRCAHAGDRPHAGSAHWPAFHACCLISQSTECQHWARRTEATFCCEMNQASACTGIRIYGSQLHFSGLVSACFASACTAWASADRVD